MARKEITEITWAQTLLPTAVIRLRSGETVRFPIFAWHRFAAALREKKFPAETVSHRR